MLDHMKQPTSQLPELEKATVIGLEAYMYKNMHDIEKRLAFAWKVQEAPRHHAGESFATLMQIVPAIGLRRSATHLLPAAISHRRRPAKVCHPQADGRHHSHEGSWG